MRKDIGSICLIAGTAIGAGTLALPLVLAGFGLLISTTLMGGVWAVMYYSALVNVELNLRAGEGLTLGALGRKFSGATAEFIGHSSLKLLCYALLCAYIYAGTSVIQKLTSHFFGTSIGFVGIAALYTLALAGILFLKLRTVDYINRSLFLALLVMMGVLIGGILLQIDFGNLPLLQDSTASLTIWHLALPTMFTSFGFQVIFHTLTNYCDRDPQILKRAFFWGSLIPLIIYVIWSVCVLGVIYHYSPDFYHRMVLGGIELGDLIQQLSLAAQWPLMQLLSWVGSILVIVTSVIGVSIGLMDSWRPYFEKRIECSTIRSMVMVGLTLLPPFLISVLFPNVFISALGFAGMVLVIIAILLPIYLLHKSNKGKFFYPILKSKALQAIAVIFGLIIILCEVLNLVRG